jgi:hypothetical protein
MAYQYNEKEEVSPAVNRLPRIRRAPGSIEHYSGFTYCYFVVY